MKTNNEIHTIFGAGQVGRKLAEALLALGKEVRILRRGEAGPARPGLTWLRGDLLDPAIADAACEGAAVVYHCANPARYDRWDRELPPLFEAIVGAARRADARLVVLDNLYMYGRADGAPFRESTPMRPCSDKGRLRAELAQKLLDLQASGEMDIAIGRASDYFGPDTAAAAVFHPRFFSRLAAGRPLELLGDPDALHSYSYTPDVAAALATLGTDDRSWGHIWHLPVAFQGTSRQLATRFAEAAGRRSRVTAISRTMVRVLGLFSGQLRAVVEMMYQFEEDFVVDDARFRETFSVAPTPIDEAVQATLASQHSAEESPAIAAA